ncbi:putative Casein kinase I [Blattamonas nauphoetae]|uniref:Casein kinase I n=1 Tax=Blattamonas nauphoetae TaxID=2049346 RepID=A0ABQ9X1K3_9EUKA|nr:putative Casein kinase I [Blattamonas nauphoetae]
MSGNSSFVFKENFLGQGSFGHIVECYMIGAPSQKYAAKVETVGESRFLQNEFKIYQQLANGPGIPSIKWYGKNGERNALVMDLLGANLETLKNKQGEPNSTSKLDLKTMCMVADQLISRLEFLHSKGYIHQDVKPDNFVVGLGEKKTIIYMIDFGLSQQLFDPANISTHPEEDTDVYGFVGTLRYCPPAAHQKKRQTRKDDMISLGYVLYYLSQGSLPWQSSQIPNITVDKILEAKLNFLQHKSFLEKENEPYRRYMEIVTNLGYSQVPPYFELCRIFRSKFIEEGMVLDFQFNWNAPEQVNEASDRAGVNPMKTVSMAVHAFSLPMSRSNLAKQPDEEEKEEVTLPDCRDDYRKTFLEYTGRWNEGTNQHSKGQNFERSISKDSNLDPNVNIPQTKLRVSTHSSSVILAQHSTPSATASAYFRNDKCVIEAEIVSHSFAFGTKYNQRQINGWDKIYLSMNGSVDPMQSAFCMGAVEGYMMQEEIHAHRLNMADYLTDKMESFEEKNVINDFASTNRRFVETWTKDPNQSEIDFVRCLLMEQFNGLHYGFNYNISDQFSLSKRQLWKLQCWRDCEDFLLSHQTRHELPGTPEEIDDIFMHGSGGIIVKVVETEGEVFVGHTTSGHYSSLVRCLKEIRYVWDSHDCLLSYSGYPGVLSSTDSFVVINGQTAITTTPMMILNHSMWDPVTKNGFPFWIREMTANILGKDAEGWTNIMTLNSTFSVPLQGLFVDYSKLSKEKHIVLSGVVTRMEVFRDMSDLHDLTPHLTARRHYTMFGVPTSKNFHTLLGFENVETSQTLKPYFGLNTSARHTVSEKIIEKVFNEEGMQNLMGYNDWTNDREGRTEHEPDSILTIAQRGELREKRKRAWGSLDWKIASARMTAQQDFLARAFPTSTHQLPLVSLSSLLSFHPFSCRGMPSHSSYPVVHFSLSPNHPSSSLLFIIIAVVAVLSGTVCFIVTLISSVRTSNTARRTDKTLGK